MNIPQQFMVWIQIQGMPAFPFVVRLNLTFYKGMPRSSERAVYGDLLYIYERVNVRLQVSRK